MKNFIKNHKFLIISIITLIALCGSFVYLVLRLSLYISYLGTVWGSDTADIHMQSGYYYESLAHFIVIICLLIILTLAIIFNTILTVEYIKGKKYVNEEIVCKSKINKEARKELKRQQKIEELQKQLDELKKDE